MSSDHSAQYFTLDNLVVFKEKVIKNYLKLNENDAYINGVIYNAMMKYKRDIVQFCSGKRALPSVGNPGTLYMTPKSKDDPDYAPTTNEIWVTSNSGFTSMRLRVDGTTNPDGTAKYIDMPLNEHGYFVLDLNNVPDFTNNNVRFHASAETSAGSASTDTDKGSTTNLQLPTVTGSATQTYITTRTQLYTLRGKIISVNKNMRGIGILPSPQLYSGNNTDIQSIDDLTISSDEIWIDSANWSTLTIAVNVSGTYNQIPLTKNAYGYYVLYRLELSPYTGSSYFLWAGTNDINFATFNNTNGDYRVEFSHLCRPSDTRIYANNLFTYLGGKRIVLHAYDYNGMIYAVPDDLPIITYTGGDTDQFTVYAYENNKYVGIGNVVFNSGDYAIDRSLDSNSIHTIQNKRIYEALQTKYDADDITDVIEEGNNKIATSRAIQAALAPKLDWADLRNITLYQLMRELRFDWNMPTSMYFKLVVYAPLREQDLAIYYPLLTQRIAFTSFGTQAFVPTNKFTYSSYNSSYGTTVYTDTANNNPITLQNTIDTSTSSGNRYQLSGYNNSTVIQAATGADLQFTITSQNPVSMTTLAEISYKIKAYTSSESSAHNHINKIYVSTYLSPDGVDWHPLQNKTIYNWDDNYEDLNDYIYIIPILA